MTCPQCERDLSARDFLVSAACCYECHAARTALNRYWRLPDVDLPLSVHKSFKRWLPLVCEVVDDMIHAA